MTKHLFFFFAIAFALSGCFERESSCYERLDQRLESLLQTAKEIEEPRGINDLQMEIIKEQIRLQSLFYDDSVNVCDFYLDQITLRRK